METLGVGVIGFGFIGKVHVYGYRNMGLFYDPVPVRTRLVGVATAHAESAKKAAAQGGFEFGTSDWRELIARDDIQIINICTPNVAHSEQLLAAMAAGKHIYCDKPLVIGDEAMAQVGEALQRYRGIGQVTLQNRFFPATLHARQLIDDGFIGNVIGFRAAYLHAGSVDPRRPMGWKQLKSSGGGVLQDLGSHLLDLMDHLIGPFDSVLTTTRILYPERPTQQGGMVAVEADDQMLMLAKLPNGAMGTLEASKIATGAEDELRFEIHGDQGALRFNLMDPNYLEAYDLREPEMPFGGQRGWRKIACVQRYEKPAGFPTPKASIGWLRGHVHSLYTFLQAVASGQQAEPSLQHGLHLQRMLTAAEQSARTQEWTRMPR